LWPRLREIWDYRELLWFLTLREVTVRYKQTLLGALWAIVQPLLTMIVFSLFLGRLAGVPSDGVPYPLFVYCGLLPWQLFAYALTSSANSLVANERLVTKVYFPRALLPIAAVLSGLIDFALALLLLAPLLYYYGRRLGWAILMLPLAVLLALLAAIALGLSLAALNAQFRDVRYALPFLTQIWMFASPIAYPSSLLPGGWRIVYGLNPLAGVIETFRWSLLAHTAPPLGMVALSCGVIFAGLGISLRYFIHVERDLADVI
jgi:lipopolysaccharide transport system permease protein